MPGAMPRPSPNPPMARIDRLPIETPKLPTATTLRVLARTGRFVRPYGWRIVVAVVALVTAASAMLAIGQGLRVAIDSGFLAGDPGALDGALAWLLLVVVVMAVATYVRFYFVSWLGERVTADLRRAVFDHILKMPPGWFEMTRTGEVISRLTSDTAMLDMVIGTSASLALRNLLLLVGGLVMLGLTSLKLTLFVLVGVPLTVAPIVLSGRRARRLARASQDRLGDVGAYVDESLHERLNALAAELEGSPSPLSLAHAWDLVAELLGPPGQAGPLQAVLMSPRAEAGA